MGDIDIAAPLGACFAATTGGRIVMTVRRSGSGRTSHESGIDRRAFMTRSAGAAAALAIPALAITRAVAAAGEPIVETTSGKIRGASVDGVYSFKGVPYGASTAAKNRFMPPRKPEAWAGVRDALSWAGHAPQSLVGVRRRPELAELAGPPDTVPESEDCLTLNLWTRGLDDAGKRPVMVWYHGGAFSYGSANQPRTDGTNLAKRGDVVVVTVNQRLNILGHLDLAEFGGAEFVSSGNGGTLDMLAALEWVRDNVARFGGDPGNVTIFGESGGGGKVSTLLAMPAARGLFHRAIIQSGAATRLRERDRAARITEAVLQELGLGKADLASLQTLPVERLIAAIGPAQKAVGPPKLPLFDRYDFGPVVDGTVLPAHPFDPVATDLSDDVPVIVGGMKDEMAIFLAPDDKIWHRTLGEDELKERVQRVAGDATDRVIETYRRLHPEMNPAERLIAILTDSNFRIRSLLLAERKAAKGKAPVYLYSFDWETPVFDGRLKAFHALDVPFTFDTIDFVGATDRGPAARQLAAAMSGTWAQFARTGKPDNPAIPVWPAYTSADRATMVLDKEWRLAGDYGRETRLLWSEITRS
jgi:para-nitrobenzyl esterase